MSARIAQLFTLLFTLLCALLGLTRDPPPPAPPPAPTVWDRLADCEVGLWDADGKPIDGTARWDYSDGHYEGGLNFAPSTWDAFRDPTMPDAAYKADRATQVAVGRRVYAAQGWDAWPVCSAMLGLEGPPA